MANRPVTPISTQGERFIEAARELGCDESEETFRAAVRKVAKAPYTSHDVSKGKRSAKARAKRDNGNVTS